MNDSIYTMPGIKTCLLLKIERLNISIATIE